MSMETFDRCSNGKYIKENWTFLFLIEEKYGKGTASGDERDSIRRRYVSLTRRTGIFDDG